MPHSDEKGLNRLVLPPGSEKMMECPFTDEKTRVLLPLRPNAGGLCME